MPKEYQEYMNELKQGDSVNLLPSLKYKTEADMEDIQQPEA
jgi:hypothetical protein